MKCIVCKNSENLSLYFKNIEDMIHKDIKGKYNLKICKKCKLIFIDPQPNKRKLLEHYPDKYSIYNSSYKRNNLKSFVIKKVAENYFGYSKRNIINKFLLFPLYFKLGHLPYHVKKGCLLEIGCATGIRLLMFKNLGFNAEGLEIDSKACKKAVELTDCRVYNTMIENIKIKKRKYDVVYMNNVFEHLYNPEQSLDIIRKILKKNGQLIMVLPNTKSMTLRIFKQNTFLLDVPRHLFDYNEENIKQLLLLHGFEILKITYSHNLSAFSSSLALFFGKKAGDLAFIDKFTWLFSFIFDPIMNLFKTGDLFSVHAIKKAD